MTFRGRLTAFFAAIVLAPLLAGGIAAHLLAMRQAVHEADARLQSAEIGVQRVEHRELDGAISGLTTDLARRAFRASPRALDNLRVSHGLGFLLVARNGRVTTSAMGHPAFRLSFRPRPKRVADLDGLAPYVSRVVRITGTPYVVAGGEYLDRRFLARLPFPGMIVVGGRVVASTVPDGPGRLPRRQLSTLPDGRRVLFTYARGERAGVAIVAPVRRAGLLPAMPGWMLVAIALGVVVGAALAFELARVLSKPHERALGRLAETERMSVTDALTGIPNRRYLQLTLTEEAKRAHRFARPFSILMVDVDHFKRINDSHGHAVGDQVLIDVANRLRVAVRADLDTVARFGGEEFTVVLPETDPHGAMVVAEKIREAVASRPLDGGVSATVSVGVASCPDDGTNAEDLLRAADAALYEAKRAGRDRVIAGR